MIFALTVILICQLVGEVVVRGSGLPVPGPVLGMVLLLVILALRDRLRPKRPARDASELPALCHNAKSRRVCGASDVREASRRGNQGSLASRNSF